MTVVKRQRPQPDHSPPMLLYEASWQRQVWSNLVLILWIGIILAFCLTRLILKVRVGRWLGCRVGGGGTRPAAPRAAFRGGGAGERGERETGTRAHGRPDPPEPTTTPSSPERAVDDVDRRRVGRLSCRHRFPVRAVAQ